MSMAGVGKIMTTVNSVAKRATKTFVSALPLMSVGANVLLAGQQHNWDPGSTLRALVRRYGAFDLLTGKFDASEVGAGTGSLVVTAIVSKVVKDLI